MSRTIFLISVLFLRTIDSNAQNPVRYSDFLSVNNCKMWVMNNGMEAHNAILDSAGFIWPKDAGSLKHLIYMSGLLLGGWKGSDLSVGGIYYGKSTYLPGVYGETKARNDSLGRIWHIRKNWRNLPDGDEKEYYEFCYKNWPGEIGAPFVDNSGNGHFERDTDKPDFIGDEVIFYSVYNSPNGYMLYEDDSIHSEIQINFTLWAYDSSTYLQDAVFEKIEMINKSPDTLYDFYAAYWVDADLGYPMDDYVGCDSSLYLGLAWNSFPDDPFYGSIAPSVGHVMLSGFMRDGKNLMMTAFGPNFKISSSSYDPRDVREHYNVIRGLLTNGDEFINPYNNQATSFPLSGDPESLNGWYEGAHWPAGVTFGSHPPYPGDRRYYISTGPITFLPSDTQKIVLAHIAALGESNRNSITVLKNNAYLIHRFYGNDFITGMKEEIAPPERFIILQNYPNPFGKSVLGKSATTNIKYSVPNFEEDNLSARRVKLTVYDILGRKVATLVDEVKLPGSYEKSFDGYGLASGVYFYKLEIIPGMTGELINKHRGKTVKIKKMVLVN